MRRYNYRKAVQALNLLAIRNGGDINKMKALKLIWLADRLHLRKYGRPILQDNYVAMKHGPVASSTRDILEGNQLGVGAKVLDYSKEFINPANLTYASINNVMEKVFSESDLEALNAVYNTYGHFDQFQLRDITHQFPEWKKWEEGLNKNEYKRHPMSYNDFFLETVVRHPVFDEEKEILQLTQQIFSRQTND